MPEPNLTQHRVILPKVTYSVRVKFPQNFVALSTSLVTSPCHRGCSPRCWGAASLAVLLQHGPGPEHEAVLVAHLAAALVTHAASLPANVQTAGASEVNLLKKKKEGSCPISRSLRGWTRSLLFLLQEFDLGSSRSLTSEVKKQPPRSN